MIPILYLRGQTIFMGSGVGPLADTISCECTEKLNDIYELTLKLPANSIYANVINYDCIIKVKPNHEDRPQPFRIYDIEKNYDGYINIKAAHISYDTAGIPIMPFEATNLDDAIDNLNTNRKLLSDSNFVLNSDFSKEGTLKVEKPSSFRSLLGGSKDSIQSVYGGEYYYDNYTINLLEHRGKDKGVCFRYGKSISDFQQTTNTENVYTAVMGFWKKNDTIIYGDIIETESDFPYDKIYILDTSSEIETQGNANATVDQINSYVEKYIVENVVGLPEKKMRIDYTDTGITKICVGDTVGVFYPDYNISAVARCNTVVFDCLEERNKSIEIGVEDKDLADTISGMI